MKERHSQILEAIKGFYQEYGFCPTVRQIGDMVGLKSTSSVITHLKAMEDAGIIIRNEFSPRSIIIPGFNNKNHVNDNIFEEKCTKKHSFDTFFVLHGHFSMPGEEGVNVWGVSNDLGYLSEKMMNTGDQMILEAEKSDIDMSFDRIEKTKTRYEAENRKGTISGSI